MAVIEMNPDAKADKPISAAPSAEDLFSRYKLAKAEYERAIYAGSVANVDCDEEILRPLSNAHDEALRALMFRPAESLRALVHKLEAFREEDAHEHHDAAAFIAHMAIDARSIYQEERAERLSAR